MSAERGRHALALTGALLPTLILGTALVARMEPLQTSLGPRARPPELVDRTATPPSVGSGEGSLEWLRDARLDDSLRKAVVVRDGKRRSLRGLFRGQTEATEGGSGRAENAVGSMASERRCERALGKTSAHVCTASELSESGSFGIAVPRGWCLGAAAAPTCTSAAAGAQGAVWSEAERRAVAVSCGESWPVLCCD